MSSEQSDSGMRTKIVSLFCKLCSLEMGVEDALVNRYVGFEDDHMGHLIAVLDTAKLPSSGAADGEDATIEKTGSLSERLGSPYFHADIVLQYKVPLLFGRGQGRQQQFEIVLEDPGEEYRIGGCLPKLVTRIPVNDVSVRRLQEAVNESFIGQVRKQANELFFRIERMKEGIPEKVMEQVQRAEKAWMAAMKSPANPAPK